MRVMCLRFDVSNLAVQSVKVAPKVYHTLI